jgi:hypothetical protein
MASAGFSLVEAVAAVFFLGLLGTAVATVYSSGLRSLDEQESRMLLDGKIRSRMELLIAEEFGALVDGSEVVTIKAREFLITWTVVPADVNGDSTPEPNAREVTVSVSGMPDRSLTTLLVDHEGRVSKI